MSSSIDRQKFLRGMMRVGQKAEARQPEDPALGVVDSPVSTDSALIDSPSPASRPVSFDRTMSMSPPPASSTLSSPRVGRSSSSMLTPEELNQQASQIILNALERTHSPTPKETRTPTSSSSSFGRISLSSMIPSLSVLSLSSSRDKDETSRGRTKEKGKDCEIKRASSAIGKEKGEEERSGRPRSSSPFLRRRSRLRDRSPSVEALRQDDGDSDNEVPKRTARSRTAFAATDDEAGGSEDDDGDSTDATSSESDHFDPETEENTERNAALASPVIDDSMIDVRDPLGEGVNVIRAPPEPFFQATSASIRRRKKSVKHETIPLVTGRPQFSRDRCTVVVRHGEPAKELEANGRRQKRYFVASDLSEESKYAVEWCIGTVLRDGDEMILITVQENEAKLDDPNAIDRIAKLRNQQERQTLAFLLVRQVTGLLQRTKLHVTVTCQALHARKCRHMLIDLIDAIEPTMVIVGSRGVGQLKGILLGSTSHYLIQKSSVPVMVARRRLRRYVKKTKPYVPGASPRKRVPLAQAAIEKVGPGKLENDVQTMRKQIETEEEEEIANHGDGSDSDKTEGEEGVKLPV